MEVGTRCHDKPPLLYPHLDVRQLDVIREELARSQSLRHRDVWAIHLLGETCDGIQAYVTLQRRRNPRTDATFACQPYPLLASPQPTMQRWFQNDVMWANRVQQTNFLVWVVHADELLVQRNWQR